MWREVGVGNVEGSGCGKYWEVGVGIMWWEMWREVGVGNIGKWEMGREVGVGNIGKWVWEMWREVVYEVWEHKGEWVCRVSSRKFSLGGKLIG